MLCLERNEEGTMFLSSSSSNGDPFGDGILGRKDKMGPGSELVHPFGGSSALRLVKYYG